MWNCNHIKSGVSALHIRDFAPSDTGSMCLARRWTHYRSFSPHLPGQSLHWCKKQSCRQIAWLLLANKSNYVHKTQTTVAKIPIYTKEPSEPKVLFRRLLRQPVRKLYTAPGSAHICILSLFSFFVLFFFSGVAFPLAYSKFAREICQNAVPCKYTPFQGYKTKWRSNI